MPFGVRCGRLRRRQDPLKVRIGPFEVGGVRRTAQGYGPSGRSAQVMVAAGGVFEVGRS